MELNLRKLLQGQEGKYFYHLDYGKVRLVNVNQDENDIYPIVISHGSNVWSILKNGMGCQFGSAHLFFPSRELFEKYPLDAITAWNVWYESVNPKVKTWEDVDVDRDYRLKSTLAHLTCVESNPYVKSAIALIKIQHLIELGYGGVPTTLDWRNNRIRKCCLGYFHDVDRFEFCEYSNLKNCCITFRSEDDVRSFLSHESNVQLLKDLYMI